MTNSPIYNFAHLQPRAGSPEVPINEWMDGSEGAQNRRVEWDAGTKTLLTQDDLASALIHVFTGNLSGQVELFVAGLNEDDEPLERFFIIENQTTENIVVSISGQSGLSVVVPASFAEALHTDGVNVRIITFNTTILSTESGGGGVGSSGALSLIEEVITTGSQTEVVFSSIPASYRDLEVRVRGRGTAAAVDVNVKLQMNGDTGNNYSSYLLIEFTGTDSKTETIAGSSIDIGRIAAASAPAAAVGLLKATVSDYKGTTWNKEVHSAGAYRRNTTAGNVLLNTAQGEWVSTAAISSLRIFPITDAFVDGSIVSLYGHA